MISFGSNKELNYINTINLVLSNGSCFCLPVLSVWGCRITKNFMSGNDWLEHDSIVRSGDNVNTCLYAEPLARLFIIGRSPHKFPYYLFMGLSKVFILLSCKTSSTNPAYGRH